MANLLLECDCGSQPACRYSKTLQTDCDDHLDVVGGSVVDDENGKLPGDVAVIQSQMQAKAARRYSWQML